MPASVCEMPASYVRCLQACVRPRPWCTRLCMHCDDVELCAASASCVGCTQLYTHCEDVEAVNAARLGELPGEAVRFRAQDTGRTEALQACQVSMDRVTVAVPTARAGNLLQRCTPRLSLQSGQR